MWDAAAVIAAQKTKSWHPCKAYNRAFPCLLQLNLLVPAEKACGCLQVGVKRGGRRGSAFHRAKPFARESGRQTADLTEAGSNGQDAVMFLGSQGALLGAVQVRIH